jgi:hypothetical protein
MVVQFAGPVIALMFFGNFPEISTRAEEKERKRIGWGKGEY